MGPREKVSCFRCAQGGTDQSDKGFREERDRVYET